MISKVKADNGVKQVIFYVILILIFAMENILIIGKYDIRIGLDNMIPFIPIFVIPYFIWYIVIVFTGIYFLIYSREDLEKTFLSLNICMIISMIIYVMFPNYQSLRPAVYENDFFSQWVRLLQIGDNSSSVCPSIHVAVSVSIYLGIINSHCFKDRQAIKISAFVLTFLICISTVFIKQHSIVDVAAGMLLSSGVYVYVYKIRENKRMELSEPNPVK